MTPKETVLKALEAINAGDLESALSFYSDSVQQLSPSKDGCSFRERIGKDSLRRVLAADISEHRAKFVPRKVVCEGNTVAVESVNKGDFNDRHVEQPVAAFFEVQQGLIVSVTVYYDRLGLRKALGQA